MHRLIYVIQIAVKPHHPGAALTFLIVWLDRDGNAALDCIPIESIS